MDSATHISASDFMIWLRTVTKLKGKSNYTQWYSDLHRVSSLIDPDFKCMLIGATLPGTLCPPNGPVAELEADDLAAKAGDEYGKKREDTSYKLMEDWELRHITKPRERYRRWQRNKAIARHALTLTIDPSLRHLIEHIASPYEALIVLGKKFDGSSKSKSSYSKPVKDESDSDTSDDEDSDSDSSDEVTLPLMAPS
ncbi:hypothetical protein N7540_004636 [Penicillium herquei]|nr:hypothetical protein N7540_004636 [Penicillium herquei]